MTRRLTGDALIMCFGKKVYPSYWSAARSSKTLNKRYQKAKANPYRCPSCRGYHVGNTMGEMRVKRINRHTAKGLNYGSRI